MYTLSLKPILLVLLEFFVLVELLAISYTSEQAYVIINVTNVITSAIKLQVTSIYDTIVSTPSIVI